MFENSCVVLTPGRTGSVLLASHLARRKYHSLLVYLDTLEDLDRLQWLKDCPTAFHSHGRFSLAELDYVKPVYSVRRNLIEAIVSHALSNTLQLWHVPSHDQRPDLDTVTLTLQDLDAVIDSQRLWFQHYFTQLDSNSIVVIYEVFIDLLPASLAGYSRVYPDKAQLIQNYDWAQEYVRSRISTQMWDQHAEFCDYPARVQVPSPYPHLLS